jgi:hypothetical protein
MSNLVRTLFFSLAAFVLPMQMAHADLFAGFINGTPVGPGQSAGTPTGGKWQFVKIPRQDLAYYVWVETAPPPPPPPPKTYRIKDPTNRIIDLGDGSKGTPKQQGKDVVIIYRDGETVVFPNSTLIKPGEPDPSAPQPKKGAFNGPADELAPSEALADALLLMAQPEFIALFTTPVDLSYFKYDFFGTTPFPVFRGSMTYTSEDGLVSTVALVPEPGTLALGGMGVLAWLALRRRRLPHTAIH